MTERVLVAGVGNIFRSDDGFGSAVADELLRRQVHPDVRVVDYGLRGIHLAFDLAPALELLVLLDTIPDAGGGPGSVALVEVDTASFGQESFDAHAMDPGAVFRSLGALTETLPRTVVVGCQPDTLADGIGLSPLVGAAVAVAADHVVEFTASFLAEPRLEHQLLEGGTP